MHNQIPKLYDALKIKAKKNAEKDLKGDVTSEKLINLIVASRVFLDSLPRAQLVSYVKNKRYFVFCSEDGVKSSRPVNYDIFVEDVDRSSIEKLMSCDLEGMSSEYITKLVYTCAISYCCATDILKKDDKKTPGTFFEYIIGHLVARKLNVNPQTTITVPTLGNEVELTTDFIFDLGPEKNRLHLPIKISTRERVVQVWAHQRVLDGMHGVARFKGVLVAMAETNKQLETMSVTEVCLPHQWATYQMYISQLFRVYYLDVPEEYLALKNRYPFIQVKPFGDFFGEVDKIERSGVDA